FYYNVIKGFSAAKGGNISGIKTPDKYTIVFNLTSATGDFLYRMGMPATGPVPAEVTKCFEGQANKYGQDLISTAGYMIQGIDKVDTSSCSSIKPASGYDGATGTHLILDRNPNYNQASDQYRQNNPDQFQFLVDANSDDIFNKVAA